MPNYPHGRYGNPQGPPDWQYSMPPPSGGTDPGGYQPTDQWGYPINPGFTSTPSPTPYPSPTASPTATPSPDPGNPTDTSLTITPPGNIGSNPFGGDPYSFGNIGAGFNYYDAGNGTLYVYDSNWNYVTTTTTGGNQSPQPSGGGNPSAPSSPSFDGGSSPSGAPPPSMPWYAGAGPLPGGNQNPGNPGYVAPRATTGDVYTPGQSGWESTGSSFNFLLPGGVTAKNI